MLNYYQQAKKSSLSIGKHPGLISLRSDCHRSLKILDVGCGEGSRLHTLLKPDQIGWGIDLNITAIKQAKKQYPHFHFKVADGENIPFPNNSFDMVYSCFAIEHCQNPEKFISEMLRVTTALGHTVIICPNYGAPNRRSPVSTDNPVIKLFLGIISDFFPKKSLNWQSVNPKYIYDEIDSDTTVEPYLHSLLNYVTKLPCTLTTWSSLWILERNNLNTRQLLFAVLGKLSIPPFVYWGPQIYVSLIKQP